MTVAIVVLILAAALLASQSRKSSDPAKRQTMGRIAIGLAVLGLILAILSALEIVQDHGGNSLPVERELVVE